MPTYTTINGQRVEVNAATAFGQMAAEFKRVHGVDLLVTSGTRTKAEQTAIFLARYVTAGGVRGRKVYDTRWWNGQLWYRVSSAGTVAVPGTSNHEETGPVGASALDVRDSGRDAGVTRAGTARSNWLRDNASRWGFVANGLGFGEPWHIEYRGGASAGPASGGAAGFSQTVANEQAWMNASRGEKLKVDGLTGPATIAAKKRYQTFLRGYGYKGAIDGLWGAGTQTAHAAYYAAWNAPKASPAPAGKVTTASFGRVDVVQKALKTKYPAYARHLVVDNLDGPKTIAAVKEFQRRAGLHVDGIAGPSTRKALGV